MTFAAFSFHPFMQVLSFPWMGPATGNPKLEASPESVPPFGSLCENQPNGRATKVLI
jgi:hypothetical protein